MKENNEKKKNYNSKRKENQHCGGSKIERLTACPKKGKDQREYERNVIL